MPSRTKLKLDNSKLSNSKLDNLKEKFKKFKIKKNLTLQSILAKFNTKGPRSMSYI